MTKEEEIEKECNRILKEIEAACKDKLDKLNWYQTGLAKEMDKVVFYGAILVADNPLPDYISINAAGQVVVTGSGSAPAPPSPTPGSSYYVMDFNKARKKKFTDLTKGRMYYIYFYAGNSGGISPLSEGAGLDPLYFVIAAHQYK